MSVKTDLIERRLSLPEWLAPTICIAAALLLARWWSFSFVPSHTTSLWGAYFFGPLAWAIAGGIALYFYRKRQWQPVEGVEAVDVMTMMVLAAIVGSFIVSTQILLGLFADFGRSPFAHSPKWLLINLFFAGSTLMAVESSRAYLLRTFSTRNLTAALLLTSLVLVAVQLPTSQFLHTDVIDQAKFWGSIFIPLAATGLVAGFFVLYGGLRCGILVTAPLVAFQYLSPVLPVANWPLMALAGVAGPSVGLWIAESMFAGEETDADQREHGLPSIAWIVTAVLSLTIFWFSFGFFGYRPMFVPSTSMVPAIERGDVVILGPVDPDRVQVGDVLLYSLGGRTRILHRVVEIRKGEDGQRVFLFKGDHNNAEDLMPVPDKGLKGRYVVRAPKIGWLPIKFQQELAKLK